MNTGTLHSFRDNYWSRHPIQNIIHASNKDICCLKRILLAIFFCSFVSPDVSTSASHVSSWLRRVSLVTGETTESLYNMVHRIDSISQIAAIDMFDFSSHAGNCIACGYRVKL